MSLTGQSVALTPAAEMKSGSSGQARVLALRAHSVRGVVLLAASALVHGIEDHDSCLETCVRDLLWPITILDGDNTSCNTAWAARHAPETGRVLLVIDSLSRVLF